MQPTSHFRSHEEKTCSLKSSLSFSFFGQAKRVCASRFGHSARLQIRKNIFQGVILIEMLRIQGRDETWIVRHGKCIYFGAVAGLHTLEWDLVCSIRFIKCDFLTFNRSALKCCCFFRWIHQAILKIKHFNFNGNEAFPLLGEWTLWMIPNVWGCVIHLAGGGPCFLETQGPKFQKAFQRSSQERRHFKNFGKILTNQGHASLFAKNYFCKLSVYKSYQLETSSFLAPIKDRFFLCWITIPAHKTRCTLRQPIWTARPIWRPRWCEIRHNWKRKQSCQHIQKDLTETLKKERCSSMKRLISVLPKIFSSLFGFFPFKYEELDRCALRKIFQHLLSGSDFFESDGQAPNASFKLVGQHVTWRPSNDCQVIMDISNSEKMYQNVKCTAFCFFFCCHFLCNSCELQFGSWVEGHVESKACWADVAGCKFQACFVFIWWTPRNDNIMMMMMMMNLKTFTCPYGYSWGNLF